MSPSHLLPLLLFLVHLVLGVHSANILVISPSLSPSLMLNMGRLADTLVATGRHNVTVWIPEMWPIDMNGTRLAQRVVRMRNLTNAFAQVFSDEMGDTFSDRASSFATRMNQDMSMAAFCQSILERKSELEPLRAAKFDLAFSNMVDLCYQGLVHALGIPRHIWVSTGPLPDAYHWFLGVPEHLSSTPILQVTVPLGPRMDFWERARNIADYVFSCYTQSRMFRAENALFRAHFGDSFPPLEQLASNHDLVFAVTDEFIDLALPSLAKVIPIGGLGFAQTPKPLSRELVATVESGRKGAVLFSLGSAVNTAQLNERKKASLFDAFAAFPDYAFIVKVSQEDEFSRNWTAGTANVHLFDWLPQTDLLAHPSVRLFITHSGHNSLLEAAIRGVPLLAIPLVFDQFRNAKSAEYRGFARVLAKSELEDGAKVGALLREMLANTHYKASALRLAKLHREKPQPAEQRLVEWTEFVLANGPLPELVPESVRMPLWAYLCADLALAAVILAAVLVWLGRTAIGWASTKIGGAVRRQNRAGVNGIAETTGRKGSGNAQKKND